MQKSVLAFLGQNGCIYMYFERGFRFQKLSFKALPHGTIQLQISPTCTPNILKGQCHPDFLLLVFSWISFPPAPEYPSRIVSNFFKYSRRYSQVKVHHRYQRHRWQICHRYQWHRRKNFTTGFATVVDTVGKFPTSANNTGGKFANGVKDCVGLIGTTLNPSLSWFYQTF